MQWLDDLNDQQRAAATAGDGPVMIVAGPGTGKTKTLTARIAYLIARHGVKPKTILALTFTKKAAEEMQSRAAQLLGREQAGAAPHISTFHAVCLELLGGDLAFVTEGERLRIIKGLSRPVAFKGVSVRELGLLISRYKNQAEDDPALARLAAAYDEALIAQGVADFDDLLVRAKRLLESEPAVRTRVQARYRHILVDEFQDTNRLQYDVLRLLCGHDNLFVIGDPNQSIYGFRGASGTIFQTFAADYPGHTAVALTVNYRSTPAVVAVGNAVFADGPQLQAYSTATSVGAVRAVEVLNEYSEANWIIEAIQRAVGGADMLRAVSDNHRHEERSLRHFAVLYRNRSAAMALQKAIAVSGLPYQVVGDGSPYDQPGTQLLLTVLRSCVDPTTPPPEQFSAQEWQVVCNKTRRGDMAPAAVAERAIGTLGLEPTADLHQILGVLLRFDTPTAAVQYIDAIAETGFYDPQADAITLLTIHASKGLEFPYVFVLGAEEGILPRDDTTADEERRLFYVAVTRAREALDILHTRRRASAERIASRFITGLPPAALPRLVDPALEDDRRRAHKRAAKRSQQSLF